MKHQNLALVTAMFALSACGAPQYSTAKLNSEVNALSNVSSDILSQPKLAKALSGDFKNDLSKIVINSPEYIVSMSNYNRSLSEILVADADREFQISASANAGQTVKDGAGWPPLRNAAPVQTSRSVSSSSMAAPALPE